MHRYSYDTDRDGGSAAARVVRQVGFGKRVLEIGTGPGSVTRILHEQGCQVTGLEIDPRAVELCRPFCERIVQCDLESSDWRRHVEGELFDVIVAADVLEHLRDPAALLQGLASLLRPDGYVVISLPNASHLSVVACLIQGRFPYQDKGLLDSSHVRFFGRADIDTLLQACGLLWQRWEAACLEPAHAELQAFWRLLGEEDRKYLTANVADGQVYQHVIKAYPSTATGHVAKARADLLESEERLRVCEAEQQVQAASIQRLESEMERVTAELNAELKRRDGLIQSSEMELQRQTENRLALEAQIQALDTQVQALGTESQYRAAHIRALESAQAELLQSHSWRITAPLRFLVEVLRGKPR